MLISLPTRVPGAAPATDAGRAGRVVAWRRPAARPALVRGSLGLLAGALCNMSALAALSDTLHPFAAAAYSYDDNLLRLPDNEPGPHADQVRQLEAGLLLERPIGRQVLTGQAKFSRVSFARFERLDYSGKDLQAALEWHVGNHVDGHLGATRAQTLAPFTDFHISERNLRLQRREYVDGAWLAHPSWRLRAGASRDRVGYDLEQLRFNDRTDQGAELGLDYVAASGSVAGLLLRRGRSAYAVHRAFGGVVFNDDFAQDELKANIDWLFSGITRLRFVGGWVRRTHDVSSALDASGANGRLTLDWAPLGKLRFTAVGWREFSAVESTIVNSSLNKGASLAAQWDAGAKVRLDAQLQREQRDFSAVNGVALAGAATDTTRTASLGVRYAPRRLVQLGLSLFRDRRDGSALIGTNSYRANGVSFNVSAQF